MTTYEHSSQNLAAPMSSLEGRLVSRQASLPLSTESDRGYLFGPNCSELVTTFSQNGLSWSSLRETPRGRPTSLTTSLELVSTHPDLSSRLATLVRLIRAGVCSSLPAPACRDWRSPGARDHGRLSASRGQQMPEVLGTRISSHLYRWMLDLPESMTADLDHANGGPG